MVFEHIGVPLDGGVLRLLVEIATSAGASSQ